MPHSNLKDGFMKGDGELLEEERKTKGGKENIDDNSRCVRTCLR